MNRLQNRRGAALPFLILLVALFIGMAAFAIDISRIYVVRTQLQTSADAAALAAAQSIIRDDTPSGLDSAISYAQKNLTEQVPPEIEPSDVLLGTWKNSTFTPAGSWMDPNANAVQVTTHHTSDYIFGGIYDRLTKTSNVTAIAVVGSVSGTTCVRPIAIPYEMLLKVLYPTNTPSITYNLTSSDVASLAAATKTSEILLKIGDASSAIVGGNFYGIREGPIKYANGSPGNPWSGANSYRDALGTTCPNLTPLISIGDWLQAEQGNMQGPTKQGVANLCGITGNPASFACDPEKEVFVPIWDIADKSVAAPNAFRVKYVGVFKITGFSKGSPDGVTGYFSSLLGTGAFNPNPGPVRKAALMQ